MSKKLTVLGMHWSVASFALALSLTIAAFLVCLVAGGHQTHRDIQKAGEDNVTVAGQLCNENGCEAAVLFHGYITESSIQRAAQLIGQTKDLKWVCLESPGGDADSGLRFANYIRENNLGTCVVPRANRQPDSSADSPVVECGSACSEVWLGGKRRVIAAQGARVGFHGRFMHDHPCCAAANAIHRLIERGDYALASRRLGDAKARDELLKKAQMCGPQEFYRLHAEEAVKLGLVADGDAKSAWTWAASDPNTLLPPLPQGKSCALKT